MTERVAYLLHFIDPATGEPARYKHAGHYLGDVDEGREAGRLQEHRDGTGSVLTAAARRAGLDFVITRTWPGGALKARQLKTRSGALYCPECSEHPEPGTRPRRPGAKYLTRRQREAARRDREARERAASRPEFREGWPGPGRPVAECPGCESSGRAAHTAKCDETERAVARFLADIGAEPRRETGMAESQGPLTGPELDEEISRLTELYPDAPDHLYGAPECAEADPETEHFGWSQAEPEDAGRFPLPRVLDASEASPVLAPVAATLPDHTPHADRFLAERGWHAQGGVYVREPQLQAEAG